MSGESPPRGVPSGVLDLHRLRVLQAVLPVGPHERPQLLAVAGVVEAVVGGAHVDPLDGVDLCFGMSCESPPRGVPSAVLDLHRLRVLQAVARERSFSAAARALDYTQPAIGHHIRRLEAELGTPLVIRRGRTTELTPAGAALVVRADALLAGASAAWEEVAAVAGLRAGRVRLATFPSAGATFVPPALAMLRDAHPGLEVTLVEDEPPELGRLVLRGEADLAVSFEYGGADAEPGLDRTELCREEKVAVLWAGHPLAAEPEIDLAGLRDARFIGGCPRCRGHLVALCRQAGFEPDIGLSTDDWVAVQAMVAARLGVTLLPALVLGAVRHPDVVIRPVRGRPTRTITALTLSGAAGIPSVGALLGALSAQAGRPATSLRWEAAAA